MKMIKLYEPDPANKPPAGGDPNPPPPAPPPSGDAWRTAIPEEIRADPLFKDIKAKDEKEALGIISKQLHGVQSKIGSKVVLPGKDAKPEEVKAFYKELGVPDKPEAYELPVIEPPKGYVMDPAFENERRAAYLAANLRPDQAAVIDKILMERGFENFVQMNQKQDALAAASKAALQKEWGNDFQANMNKAEALLNAQGGEEMVAVLNESGMKDDARVIKFLAKLAGQMSEASLKTPDGKKQASAGDFKAKKHAFINDPVKWEAFTKEHVKGHKEAVEEWAEIHRAEFPPEQPAT